jgi:hypothetical protein
MMEKETVEGNPIQSLKNVNLNFNVNKKPQSIKRRETQIKAI